MKLISSRESLNFLSQAAPRPWVQRLLRWMAFDEGLTAFSRKGRIQPIGSVCDMTSQLIDKAGQLAGPKMDEAIKQEFSPEIAEKLIGKDPFSRFEDEPYCWDEAEDPKEVDYGFFLYASEIDWDAGTLKADSIPWNDQLHETFFPNSEFFQTELERADFEVEMAGLSFEFSKIEMLLPSMELGQKIGFVAQSNEQRSKIGRPQKWDWEGALAHIVCAAQHPDGLPTGPGAQAKIEAMMSDWFIREAGDAPAQSQIRQRAAKVMHTLKTPERP